MKQRNLFILFISLLLLGAGCTKESLEIRQTRTGPSFYVTGEIRDIGHVDFQPFHIELGEEIMIFDSTSQEESGYTIFWENLIEETPQGFSILTGAYGNEMVGEFLFALQFWPEALTTYRRPTEAEVEAFFQPGRSFPFGGEVDVYLRLPIENPLMVWASRASYLYTPSGRLTIEEMEDLEYQLTGWPRKLVRGKRIRCTFEGDLGRYDVQQDLNDGVPGFAGTDVAVPIRNGEAVFFVEYQ